MLEKTAYGYDYRGVSITKAKGGFTFSYIAKVGHGVTVPDTLKRVTAKIDDLLSRGATVERFRIDYRTLDTYKNEKRN